mgnify:CR=1 FL=1
MNKLFLIGNGFDLEKKKNKYEIIISKSKKKKNKILRQYSAPCVIL